jgi:hypothetical protein
VDKECEWVKLPTDDGDYYMNEHLEDGTCFDHVTKICPYCGKPIKVVDTQTL